MNQFTKFNLVLVRAHNKYIVGSSFGVISFDLIILKTKVMLTAWYSAEKSERSVIRRYAELTRNDEFFLTMLNDYCIDYDINS